MASKDLVRFVYASLIRQIYKFVPKNRTLQLRKPVTQSWGSYNFTKSGKEYEDEVINSLLRSLYYTPKSTRLTREDLLYLVRSNFKIQKQAPESIASDYLDDALRYLRNLSEQRRLDRCSSESFTNGLLVEATSQFTNIGKTWKNQKEYIFTYRIRVTNLRDDKVQLIGREWNVYDENKSLIARVPLSLRNSIVGQQPILYPGMCFEYCSGSPLPTPTGIQMGCIAANILHNQVGDLEDNDSPMAVGASVPNSTGSRLLFKNYSLSPRSSHLQDVGSESSSDSDDDKNASDDANSIDKSSSSESDPMLSNAKKEVLESLIILKINPFLHIHPSVDLSNHIQKEEVDLTVEPI
uniref:ApaG domain-containing protein n=1 Tax=Polytomella parva TaxID=51329 RepID=A0A7S0UY31_9CHLO|mmetsp:Transcript_21826/g.38959  ORF Transcript_21826/g.38959 Transcript_21826/m.38959 type:complete len:352 (+) Transcript_21826:94-1149(+)